MSEVPSELEVPDQPRHLRLSGAQRTGVSLLILVPILALVEAFGEAEAHAQHDGADLVLRVEYPTRYRYRQKGIVRVAVENVSDVRIDTVSVAFDSAYVTRFSSVTFLPAPAKPFEVALTAIDPGDAQLVWVELQAERYGRHEGSITAYRPGGTDTAVVRVRTFIFP